MKRSLAILLALTMILALLAGCGGTAASADTAASESAPAAEQAAPEEAQEEAAPTEEAPAEETLEEAGSAQEASAEESPAEVDYIDPDGMYSAQGMGVEYVYPLTDAPDITIWNTLHTNLTEISKIEDFPYIEYVEKETGIHVDWTSVDQGAARDQIDLMFASGDYTDMVMNFSDSSYTLASALEDDVILDLTDKIEEFSPNYYAIVHAPGNEDYARDVTNDDGQYLCYWMFQNTAVVMEGFWIRTDMLDTAGVEELPTTYDAVEEAMLAVKNCGNYPDLKTGLLVNSESYAQYFAYGYDIPSTRSYFGLYHEGDEVRSCLTEQAERDYLTMMHDWYTKGLLTPDFVSMDSNPMGAQVTEMITMDQCVIYSGWNVSAGQYKSMASNPDFSVVGIQDPTKDGGPNHFGNVVRLNTMHNCVITSAAADDDVVETCMRYADWWYTDKGVDLYNYGEEGLAWNWNEDKTERVYTDLVTNDPDYPINTAWGRYAVYGNFIGYSNEWRGNWSYGESELNAMTVWTETSLGDYSLPTSSMTLTSDETSRILTMMGDINTYVSENLAKFVNGDKNINDDAQWEEFTGAIEALGINDIVEVYQAAYERYLNR